jgi:hypothetical protein
MFPNEVIEIIAIHLYTADKLRSLASFGECSKRLHDVVKSQLWKNVKWGKDMWAIMRDKDSRSGWCAVE